MNLESWWPARPGYAFAVWNDRDGQRHVEMVTLEWLADHFGIVVRDSKGES